MNQYECMSLDEDIEEEIHYFELIFVLKAHFHHFNHSIDLGSFLVKKVNHDYLGQIHEDIVNNHREHDDEVSRKQNIFDFALEKVRNVWENEVLGIFQTSFYNRVYYAANNQQVINWAM